MRHRFPPATIAGLAVVLTTVLFGALGSDVAGATALLGVFLFGTGIWHGVRGRSWLAPLLPQGRRVGAGSMAVGLVVMVMAGAATSATGIEVPPSPPASMFPPASSAATSPPAPRSTVSATTATATQAPSTPGAVSATPSRAPLTTDALTALATLEVKGRAPRTGYARDAFGQRWADTDRNGCDTRNDILRRDLTDVRAKPGTRDCVILSGTLLDPYTNTAIKFVRGQDTSSEVQIDHVVALSDAWQKGAQQLGPAARTLFANDPLNLLAVQGHANQQKGDGDAATWLPANKAFRCQYVARQVAVKTVHQLWVTRAEHDAIARILQQCPNEPLPEGTGVPHHTTPETTALPSLVTEPTTVVTTAGQDVYYENCAAAREAGAAPIHRGEPGYRSGLDGDDDGVACE